MVGIQYYIFFLYLHDGNRERLTRPVAHHKLLTHFRVHIFGKLVFWKFNDHVLALFTISITYRDLHSFLVTNLHSFYTFIKTFDHLSCSYSKLEWITTLRAVKCFATAKFTVIMNPYLVTVLYLLHVLCFL